MTERMTLVQARVSSTVARQLEADAQALGLANRSEAVRVALRLLHRKAEDAALVDEFDAFYGAGVQAPIGDLAAIGDQIAEDAITAREGA